MIDILNDFIALLYPRHCIACLNSLYKHEEHICNFCYINLPKTNFHRLPGNPVEILFYGRLRITMAASFYMFHKKGSIQKILHALKYRGNKELAVLIGTWYAHDLKHHALISQAHSIIPVPLHPKKLAQRGYNQSEEFAKGLSTGLSIPINNQVLVRSKHTSTQTKKNKYERWENVEDTFEVLNSETLKHTSVILVDDVITTGATIEACCQALQRIEGIRISILTIAYADT